MKTLQMIPLSLKKARTFDSTSFIDDVIGGAVKDISRFVNKLVEHNKNYIQSNPPKIVRLAEKELVKCESLLGRLLENIPAQGRPYQPSGLERKLIEELERRDGHYQERDDVLH